MRTTSLMREIFSEEDIKNAEIALNKKAYTVHDVIAAECTLEPIVCLSCGSHEVTFYQYVGDAQCAECGEWQLDNSE